MKWAAQAEIEVTNLTIAVLRRDEKRGQQKLRILGIRNLNDGIFYFDVGRRAKAMLLQQIRMLKSSIFADELKAGIWCESLPRAGLVPVAKSTQIRGLKVRDTTYDSDIELVLPDWISEFPEPFSVIGEGSMGYQYHIPEPLGMTFLVKCVARKFAPEMLNEILVESSPHIGDHNSQGFGAVRLTGFKVTEEPRKFKTL